MGEYEKAVEEFQHALAREPDSEVAYLGLATAYDRLGLVNRAEETYLRAISLRPRYWNGYSRLGAFYYARRRYADAERMFREVVNLSPDSWRGYSNIGALYYVQGRTQEAVAAYQKSLAIRPNYQAASNLGTLYFFDMADYPRAAEAFQQAVTLDDDEISSTDSIRPVTVAVVAHGVARPGARPGAGACRDPAHLFQDHASDYPERSRARHRAAQEPADRRGAAEGGGVYGRSGADAIRLGASREKPRQRCPQASALEGSEETVIR